MLKFEPILFLPSLILRLQRRPWQRIAEHHHLAKGGQLVDPRADQRTSSAIRRATDRVAFEGLRALTAGLAVGVAIFGLINSQKIVSGKTLPVVAYNFTLAVIFLLLWLALRQKQIPRRWANPMIVGMLMLGLSNVLFTFYSVREPLQNNMTALVAITAGSFLLSRRWLAVALALLIVAWAPVAWHVTTSSQQLVQYSMTLLGALVLAVTIHSARRRTHNRLRRSEARYRRLFEQSQDAVAVTTPEGRMLDINQAGLDLFGYEQNELSDFNVARDAYAEPCERERRIGQLLEGSSLERYEMTLKHRSGRHLNIESTTSAIREDGKVVAFLSVLRDVTTYKQEQKELAAHRERLEDLVRERTAQLESEVVERRRTEQERLQLETQFHEAQKLESLGVLASGIAHDFNNLLVSILGNAGLVRRHLPNDAPDQYHIQRIEVAAERAAELANQMLAYSGKGQFQFERCDLRALVQEMASLLRTSISKKARLEFHSDDDLPTIQADVTQVRQVVMNLITNASDALGEDSGHINVRVGALATAPEVTATLPSDLDTKHEPHVFLQVTDDGCGMEKATQTKLFDPFFTTKADGRGLGMAAVLGIVRGHRASIHVDTELGRGSTFTILFPATNEPATKATSEPKRDESWRADGSRVLLVDDEEAVRYVASVCLENAGFEVFVAPDGNTAIELFRERPDHFDLVLLDSRMPHLGGLETFQEMRRIKPDVKVILCSGDPETRATEGIEGLQGFISKPFRLNVLLSKVRQVVETSTTIEAPSA